MKKKLNIQIFEFFKLAREISRYTKLDILLLIIGTLTISATSLNAEVISSELQQREITGTVLDSNRNPMAGVTVMVEGSTSGTATGLDGNFTLQIPANAETLVFSFIGMIIQNIDIRNLSQVNVVMQEDAIGLDEVVAIGYGTQKRENLTGSVSYVTEQVLQSRPITNLGQGLQGAMPGLYISQSSGDPGRGTSFNVRGFTSLSGGSPLILVDGVPMDINRVNHNDVAEVSVLKDAASAAIYGARAAYGVILITTKTGQKRDKPSISLSTSYSINSPTVVMEQVDMIGWLEFMQKGSMRQNGRNYFNPVKLAAAYARAKDPSLPNVFVFPGRAADTPGLIGFEDWKSILVRDSYPMAQSNASVSGGTERFDYYTSFSYQYQEGMARIFEEKYNQYDFLARLNYDITDWFRVGTRVSIFNSDKLFPEQGTGGQMVEDRHWNVGLNWPHVPARYPNGQWAYRGSLYNALQNHTEGGRRERYINDNWMTFNTRLTPVKNMSFNVDYSYQGFNQEYMSYNRLQPLYGYTIDRAHTFIVQQEVDGVMYDVEFPIIDVDGNRHVSNLLGYQTRNYPNEIERQNWRNNYYVFNAYADYENTFTERHYFKALIGFNQENAINRNFSARRRELILDNIPSMSLAAGEMRTLDNESEYSMRGAFTRFNYIFDNRYYIEFNGRYDGSSKFPTDDRFAFFPSLSLAWRIDNEAFFAGLRDAVNMFKIRVSYGSLGNQSVADNYPYIASFGSGQLDYILGGGLPMTVYAAGLVSSTLTWETVTQQNLGVDFSFLKNRLSGSVDVYRRDTRDMLTASEPLPSILAVNEPAANAADLKTYGWDLQLDWKTSARNLNWGITVLLSDYQTEITKFRNPQGLLTSHYVGKRMGEIWGFETGGLFQTDEEAAALNQSAITGRRRQAGDLYMVDLDGDGKITYGTNTLENPGDRRVIGNSTPRYSFGVRPNVSWKAWDLDIFIQGVGKQERWLNTQYWLDHYTSEWTHIPAFATDYWSEDNREAYFPGPVVTGASDVAAAQTRFLQNTAYARLKQLTLRYSVPVTLSRRIGIERISFYFSGHNLVTISGMDFKDLADPELSGARMYPLNKSISIGTNVNF